MNKKIPWNTIIISIAIILGFVIASLILSHFLSDALIRGGRMIESSVHSAIRGAGSSIANQVGDISTTIRNYPYR